MAKPPAWRNWLPVGLGIKRWLAVLLLAITFLGLGLAYLLVDVYREVALPPVIAVLTLQFLARPIRAVILGAVGLGLLAWSLTRLNAALLAPFVRPGQSVALAVSEYRRRGRGPRIVAIGGGTGLSTLLRGLKHYTSNITAVVTVADDGGSSGRLRSTLGVLPPGDFRNCIAALADDESLVTQLFQYRFAGSQDVGGHPLGNLFITAMAQVTGSFESALVESSKVLNIRGQVLPSTLRNVTLIGEVAGETGTAVVEGESRLGHSVGAIQRVSLRPEDPAAYPPVLKAVLNADLIVLGPGSLYTSLIPNLLVPDLAAAIGASHGLKVYVCNTATQPGETDDYDVGAHARAIDRHTRPGLFPVVMANANRTGELLPQLRWVAPTVAAHSAAHSTAQAGPAMRPGPEAEVVLADLIDSDRPWRHDSEKLAAALLELLDQRRSSSF
ncbi:MAG: YvcK family protein [Anaerolineales bacterium]|nr:YvcK family protein [Anaerolineales bacterium]